MVMLGCLGSAAQTVRVTTWDFGTMTNSADSSAAAIDQAAQELKRLSPDVVFLRGVSGWKMCTQLAAALKPADYRVVACSALRGSATPGAAPRQVAILARNAAYFAWSEPWKPEPAPGGGFAFAAVQVAGHRFGFSCVELTTSRPDLDEQAARQWLATLSSFRGWANNRLEGFVAGTFGLGANEGETGRLLRIAGFSDPLAATTQVVISGGPVEAHLVPNPDAPAGLLLSRWPMTCDFDFHPAPVIVVAAPPPAPAVPAPLPLPAQSKVSPVVWWVGGGVLAFILVAIVLMQFGIRRKLSRLQVQGTLIPIGSGPYNLMIASQAMATSTTGATPDSTSPQVLPAPHTADRQSLLAHLTQWFKQAFVQRLVSDRQQLMAAQEVATRKVLAVDDRVARLELKIQEKNATYEKQIEQLNRALLTAREENRELIRAQIRLVQAEMEATRARILESELG